MLIGLAAIAAAAVLGWFASAPWRRRRERRLRVLAMQELYLRRLGMPRQKGRVVLARSVERLSDKHPDRSLEWILERLLNELERERR